MATTSEFKVGDVVECMYGRCKVKAIRSSDQMYQCIPTSWVLAQGSLPVFYLNLSSISALKLKVGDDIICNYGGVGKIEAIREQGDFVIRLANWKLAQGQSPHLYLSRDAFSIYTGSENNSISTESNQKKVQREKMGYWKECLVRASTFKSAATELFKLGKMEEAKSQYLEALESMQHMGDTDHFTDTLRAEVFETTVLCQNNVATCYLKMQNYQEVLGFARNALLLTRAMRGRLDGNVWRALLERGVTEDKLLKDWMKKALYLLAKAEIGRKDYDDAVEHLDAALKLIDGDESYEKNAAELRGTLQEAQALRKKQTKKEQKMWGAAFEKSKQEEEKQEKEAAKQAASPVRSNGPSTPKDAKSAAEEVLSKYLAPAADAAEKPSDSSLDDDAQSELLIYGGLALFSAAALYGGWMLMKRLSR